MYTLISLLQCFETELPGGYVKRLLAGLANVKSPDLPYICPVFSGTSYVGFSSQVKASSFKLKELPLGLLSGANVTAILEEVEMNLMIILVLTVIQIHQRGMIPSFHESAAFRQLLHDSGGLPRFVQIVCEEAATYRQTQPDLPMKEWDWTYLQEKCVEEISSTYHRIPEEALIDCLLGMRIDRNAHVGDQTWGQLEMSGAIVIVNRVPVVPYLGLLNFVRHSGDGYLTQLSIWPMLNAPDKEKCFTWQDWERFNMEFAVMKLKLLFKRHKGMFLLT